MKEDKFRKAKVFYKDEEAGIIEEISSGYRFNYYDEFLKKKIPISLSLPIENQKYESQELFPFFVGLLPEGWYLNLTSGILKVDKNDLFGLLLSTCHDTIGAVSIEEIK